MSICRLHAAAHSPALENKDQTTCSTVFWCSCVLPTTVSPDDVSMPACDALYWLQRERNGTSEVTSFVRLLDHMLDGAITRVSLVEKG